MNKPLFIVIEGIDGSGSSTQTKMLYEALTNLNHKVKLTHEPSDGPIGVMIRQIFKGRIKVCKDPHLFDLQMGYLFAADRHDHLHNETDGVIKLLNDGNTVISSRYYFSSLAYHQHRHAYRRLPFNRHSMGWKGRLQFTHRPWCIYLSYESSTTGWRHSQQSR